jgi:hypothetical protein
MLDSLTDGPGRGIIRLLARSHFRNFTPQAFRYNAKAATFSISHQEDMDHLGVRLHKASNGQRR